MGRRVLLAVGVAVALVAAGAAPDAHAATDFYSSFESGDPAPAWENTAEVDSHGDKKMSGVTGSSSPGIPGNIRDKVVAVTARLVGALGAVVSPPAAWVVPVTWLLAAETLPAASRAFTVYAYEVLALSPVSVKEVLVTVPTLVPLRKTW